MYDKDKKVLITLSVGKEEIVSAGLSRHRFQDQFVDFKRSHKIY